jgi:hypothetical protein
MTSWIEHIVDDAGIGAPIAFVAIYALLTVALVPGSAPSMAAGALFGAVWGSLLTVLGATLGATAAYLFARSVGSAPLRARLQRASLIVKPASCSAGYGSSARNPPLCESFAAGVGQYPPAWLNATAYPWLTSTCRPQTANASGSVPWSTDPPCW